MKPLKAEIGIGIGYIAQKFFRVLTDKWFLMIASYIVPTDSILVNVV